MCSLVGTGERSFNGDGLAAENTTLYMPSQVRRGPDGLLYFADLNNFRIRRVDADGTVSTIAGNGTHGGAVTGVPAIESPLDNPSDFDFMPDGRLAFVSPHDPRVLVIGLDGTLQVLANGDGWFGVIGNEGDLGPAIDARFVEPAGIAIASDGTIFIADQAANRIRVIRDGIVDTLAGTGAPGYRGDDGALAKTAMLNGPSALAVDAQQNVYVSDVENCLVRKITPDGLIWTVAGINQIGYSGDGGPARQATLAHADGIAVDVDGTLFIGDRFNHRLRMISPDGIITTVAGTGEDGGSGDGGPALAARVGKIARVQLDIDGSVLFTDQTNSTVRRLVR